MESIISLHHKCILNSSSTEYNVTAIMGECPLENKCLTPRIVCVIVLFVFSHV